MTRTLHCVACPNLPCAAGQALAPGAPRRQFACQRVAAASEDVRRGARRPWCLKSGPGVARQLRPRPGRVEDIGHLAAVGIMINVERHYVERAVNQEGEVADIFVQKR